MRAAIDADTKLVFIANPNNPTGSWNTLKELREFLDAVPPHVIVVLDEAYFEYSRRVDCPDGTGLLARYANLVVLRTFSKAHALAGARVGYAISQADVAEVLNRVRQPFNVSIPALIGATAALKDEQQPLRARRMVEEGLRQLEAQLPPLGVKVYPTAGNFVLAETGGDGRRVYEGLLRLGVIVRPMGGYGLPGCLRITVGTAEQNDRLVRSLAAVLGKS
jgi:histidinol-phosphate aminotransferase